MGNAAPELADHSPLGPPEIPWLGDSDATRIERARASRGLSQQRLGELAGVDRKTISRAEHGICPTVRTLYHLALVLGVAMEALLEQSWLA